MKTDGCDPMNKLAVGIMSGTSLDGIDVAIARIEGDFPHIRLETVGFMTISYEPGLLSRIRQVINNQHVTTALVCSLNVELGMAYAQAVKTVCAHHHVALSALDFIASHGQTVWHMPDPEDGQVASTLQLGEGAVIAATCQTTVVSNFRPADMAAGGQGAPLVPYADHVLFSREDRHRAVLNIGGIANLTVLPKGGGLDQVFAFDTGPGVMVMDGWCDHAFDLPYDKDGLLASKGRLLPDLLKYLMEHPFFVLTPPKSTGRERFGEPIISHLIDLCQDMDKHDVLTTLVHWTALSIVQACRDFVMNRVPLDELLIGGGGAFHPLLISLITDHLPEVKVMTLEQTGFDSAAKEALAFIILGHATLSGHPANVPGATGAKSAVVLGQIHPKPFTSD